MPAYLVKALFVFFCLLLERQLIVLMPRAARPLQAVMHAVGGLAALLAANTVGGLFGAGIGLNAVTLPVAAGLGLPGAALLWALRCLL